MKGTISSSFIVLFPRIAIYSTESTLVPCGPAQRDTRLSVSLWKGCLFGMGRRPLHARIIVNSKEAQKPTFCLAFPPVSLSLALLGRLDAPAWSSVSSRGPVLHGIKDPRANVNNGRARSRGGSCKLAQRIDCLSRSVWLRETWKEIIPSGRRW